MRVRLLVLALLAPALAGCFGADDDAGPTAAFTVEETADGFRFDASPSKGDGLSYAWDLGDGATAEGAAVTHAYGFANGRVVAQLTVTDGEGRSDTTAKDVVVGTGRNGAPTAVVTLASPEAHVGEAVAVSGAGSSDPDGDALTFAWGTLAGKGGAGGPNLQEIPAGKTREVTFHGRGVHRYHMHENPAAEVAIHVEDGAPETAQVEVFGDRFEPAEPAVAPGGTVQFVNRADAGRTLMKLEYVPALTPIPTEAAEVEVAFDAPGTYVIVLTVADPLGATHTARATVTVIPQPIVMEERFTGTLQPGASSAEHALEAPAPGTVWANLTLTSDLPSPKASLTLLVDGEAVAKAEPGERVALEANVPPGALTFRVDADAASLLADYVLEVRAVLQP